MSRKSLRRLCENAYMLAVCALLLWDVPYMTEAAWTFPLREALPFIGYGLAVFGLALRRRFDGALLPVMFLAWMAGASAYAGRAALDGQMRAIANGVIALLVILPAPQIVEGKRLKAWTRCLLAGWTAALTAQAAIGLWAMLTGHAVFSLRGTWYIGLNRGDLRLYLNAYVTTGAVKMGLSAVLAVLGVAMAKRRAGRVLYGLCAATMLCCLSLTDCRTAFIAVGASLGAMLAIALLSPESPRPKRALRWAAAVLAAIMTVAGVYAALSGLVTAMGPHIPQELDSLTLMELPAHLLPEAAAEEAVQHRAIEAGNVFNGRPAVWRGALRLLAAHPRFLLTGTTAVHAPTFVNLFVDEAAGRTFYHVHSIYLHVLVAWGVPGLLLLAAMLLVFARAALRVMLRHPLPLWQRLLPVPVWYVLLCDAVDCFTLFDSFSPMLLFACFFAGWTLVTDRKSVRNAAKAPSAPLEKPVDVIIPAYNAEATLRQAVQSVLETPGARAVIVDDGSADGTADLCAELAKDVRVTVIRQENAGVSAARNTGLAAATAEYVAFLDADDLLLPGALAVLLAAGCSAAQGRVVRRSETPGRRADVRRMTGREALDAAMRAPTAHLHTHGWLFRRSLLTERFDEALTLGEDGEWMLRTLPNMPDVAFLDVPAYRYMLRPGSALRGGEAGVCGAYMKTLETAAPLLEKAGPGPAALYRLTHLLLMLTHGDFDEAVRLRETPVFEEAFRRAKLTGLSPRMCTLRLLRRRRTGAVRLAVGLRKWMNDRGAKPQEE